MHSQFFQRQLNYRHLFPNYFVFFTGVLVVCQILVPSVLPLQQFDEKCKRMCDSRRAKGRKQSFKFSCNDIESSDDKEKCRIACESCPKEVCDETLNDSSENYWNCPEENLSGKCKDVCEDHRPLGTRESYDVSIDGVVKCRDNDCPAYVCDEDNTNLYHCPYEDFEGECRLECDKIRRRPSEKFQVTDHVIPFNFKCDKAYSSKLQDLTRCLDSCRTKCPKWVCNVNKNPNEYHCPTAQIDGACKALCDNHRDSKNSDAYVFQCGDECSDFMSTCATCLNPTASHNFVCNRYDLHFFLCPPKEPDNPKPQDHLSYKGICKDRCEANRGGGFDAFEINCLARYYTDQEKLLCRQDCKNCPDDVCDEKKNDNVIKCRGVKRELEREKKEREMEGDPHKRELRTIYIIFGAIFLSIFLASLFTTLFFATRYPIQAAAQRAMVWVHGKLKERFSPEAPDTQSQGTEANTPTDENQTEQSSLTKVHSKDPLICYSRAHSN